MELKPGQTFSISWPRGPEKIQEALRCDFHKNPVLDLWYYRDSRPLMPGQTPLLLLPGFLTSALEQRREGFAPAFHVTTADLPAHPPSGPTSNGFDLMQAAPAYNSLARSLGPGPLAVGSSVGGLLALAMACQPDTPLRGAVAIDTPLRSRHLDRIGPQLWAQVEKHANQGHPQFADYVGTLLGLTGPGVVEAEKIYFDLLAASRVPVLLLTGPDAPDSQCCFRGPDRTRAEATNPDRVTVRTIGRPIHALLRDEHTAVCSAIKTWHADLPAL